MGIVKAISGHTGARGVMRYLERDGRALARDFLNIGAPIEGWEGDLPRYGACDWAAEMDSVREAAGNGRAWRGRAARTWKHYVLSPDPGSRVDLSTLRGLAVEWASEHFPDHQVAIVYHDDNEGRIPHAHVVVNNTSLETGRRLQVPDPLELNRSFQRLEAERGLPHLSNEPLARPTARARRSRGERAAEARGERSWVADIRTRADVARALAASPAEYRSLLAAMGVELADAARRGPRRDWVHSLADSPSRRIRGERLGLDYGRASVCAAVIGGAPPIDRGGGEARRAPRARRRHGTGAPNGPVTKGGGSVDRRDRLPRQAPQRVRGAVPGARGGVHRDRDKAVARARRAVDRGGPLRDGRRGGRGRAGGGAAALVAPPRRERRGALLRGGGDPRREGGMVEARRRLRRRQAPRGGGAQVARARGRKPIGRVLKVDALLERANPSASLEERCAAMGMTPEMRDAAALAAEALGEEDYEDLA